MGKTTPSAKVTLALAILIGSTAFAIDGSIPALPTAAVSLNADIGAVQSTIGLFLLGFGLGQIPVGLMADAIGYLP